MPHSDEFGTIKRPLILASEMKGMPMKSVISLAQFRGEIASTKNLQLTNDDPLRPSSIDMKVDHVTVVLGASPYIALKNACGSICLSHIKSIKRSLASGRRSYIIRCGDYTVSNDPVPVDYWLTGE